MERETSFIGSGTPDRVENRARIFAVGQFAVKKNVRLKLCQIKLRSVRFFVHFYGEKS